MTGKSGWCQSSALKTTLITEEDQIRSRSTKSAAQHMISTSKLEKCAVTGTDGPIRKPTISDKQTADEWRGCCEFQE